MQFIIIGLAFAALLWLMGLLLPAPFAISSDIADSIVGLGDLVAQVNYFLPVADIILAVGFIVGVYYWRITLRIAMWILSKLPYISG